MIEEELNQMSKNELIGIIKAQKFEIEQLENIKKEDIEYVDFNKLLDILNKGYYKNEIKGEKHD